jgi:phosphate transport system protein
MELRVGKEIGHIRELIIRMATLIEEAVRDAVNAFIDMDFDMAQSVIARDSEINSMEIEIDKEIFECLALKAPVASDLRFLFSIQKINKDLERIGDHAVNIAQAAVKTCDLGQSMSNSQIQLMALVTRGMFSDAINSFVKSNSELALNVLEHDDQVDDLNKFMNQEVINMVKRDVALIDGALELLRVSKNLERIADLSTNIAEDVIFQADAKDIKHHKKDALAERNEL